MNNPSYWQIAAGSAGREYSEAFTRYGIAFVGGESQITTMAQVNLGDRVILKNGLSKIRAVGIVVCRDGKHRGCGDKDWLRDFEGWDLQAYCYVEWHMPPTALPVAGLTRTTIQKVWIPEIIGITEKVILDYPAAPVDKEPRLTNHLDDEQIIEFLINEGLRITAAEELAVTFRRIRRLANYYYNHQTWSEIREHETRTFLVVPLLLALGWPEQSIKIEQPTKSGRVDIALFQGPYADNPEDGIAIIETKGFEQGLSYAPEQARGYAKDFPKCKVIFVSNGYCYKAYERISGEFSSVPSAYLNIREPKDAYPLEPSIPGSLDVLRLMLNAN